MVNPRIEGPDQSRILFDLQQVNEIAEGFSGCLEPEVIARRVTDGLVEKFDCAFARIWLLEPDQTTLRLVASSGMYTHTNGFFSRVPMGSYKVGKIAQNRVPFLSNNLAAEPWVGNREWAIANNIQGFAGYPLAIKNQVIGVLATFSHQAMEPEFLEVLQTLCTIVTITLETVLQYQKDKQAWNAALRPPLFSHLCLSEQLVSILKATRLTLVGTESPLPFAIVYVFLKAAELFETMGCSSCRLVYAEEQISLEGFVPTSPIPSRNPQVWVNSILGELFLTVSSLGGVLRTQTSGNQRSVQIVLQVPLTPQSPREPVQIQCQHPVLQLAFTHLAGLANLMVCPEPDESIPLLTDDRSQLQGIRRVLWIQNGTSPLPRGIQAKVDLTITPAQLRQAVEAVKQGQTWGLEPNASIPPVLSDRELEILALLTQGYRDRDIADRLVISESTVKFHLNNALTKLKARTRYQAIHQAIMNGWM